VDYVLGVACNAQLELADELAQARTRHATTGVLVRGCTDVT
jgi:hypothetical protein